MANQSAPVIDWQACHPESGLPFFCGSVEVPLDYNAPEGEKLSLALIKLSAATSTGRIGSLFFNPGGPANSGFDLVLNLSPVLPPELRERFDIIGFDPRGTVRSSPLLCFDDPVTMPQFFFPRNPEEEALRAEFDLTLASACKANGGSVLDHMSTANVARDLDFLRQAVGDSRLNYVGYSHGSFLGITYANLFPDKVRAMVLDGVIDPVAYTTGQGNEAYTLPVTTRLRIDEGSQATLNEFFRLCDQADADQCALTGAAASKFDALVNRLQAAPITMVDPLNGPFDLTYDRFISTVFGTLASSLDWSKLATALDKIHGTINDSSENAAIQAGIAFSALVALTGSAPTPDAPTHAAQQLAVMCSDSINPDNHEAWSLAGKAADENVGIFGRLAAWQSSPCAVWQGSDPDRYLGPFTQETPDPILIVGNRFDPITPYEGALQVHGLLPNSALLTLEGWGHTSLLLSTCVDQAVTSYLITSKVASTEASCQQDKAPFTDGMELISLDKDTLGELLSAGSTTSTGSTSESEISLGELLPLGSTTSTDSISLGETSLGELIPSDPTTSTDSISLDGASLGGLIPGATSLGEGISSGVTTPGESLASGETPLGEGISSGVTTPGESLASGETPLGEGISSGVTAPAGQTPSDSTTPAGQTSSGSTTPAGQTSSGSTTPPGQTSSGTSTPPGQTSSGTNPPAGQTTSNGTEASTIAKSFTIYDPDTGAVTIPAVQVGDKIEFANVKLGFNPDGTLRVLSSEVPKGSPIAASAAYDPAEGTATIPEVLVNGVVEFVNVKLAANPDGTFSVLSTEKPSVAKSFTIYDPDTGAVTIPAVQVGDNVEFANVKLGFNPEGTLNVLFSQAPDTTPVAASAAYDPAVGSATIPEVLVNGIVEFVNVKLEINPDGTFNVLTAGKPAS